jgi:hypothetical protein
VARLEEQGVNPGDIKALGNYFKKRQAERGFKSNYLTGEFK